MPAIEQRDDLYNQVKLNPKSRPDPDIGIDTDNALIYDLLDGITNSTADMSRITSFASISQQRDQLYSQLDAMAQDPLIESALEIYAEDSTERNELNQIVWVDSSNAEIQKYIQYLLDSFRINKNIYSWAYSLCKYGDIYIRLYRKSDVKDDVFFNAQDVNKRNTLNEDLQLSVYDDKDHYINYIELVSNPAEMFELTKFGKTQGYIKAPVQSPNNNGDVNDVFNSTAYTYKFKQEDITIYQATSFVHACLQNTTNRYPEQVEIFTDDGDQNNITASYKVKRGKSLLQDLFSIWRLLKLLENSVILNRVTKSSIVRLINVNVGDMPRENVGPYLDRIKSMIEQKSAINEAISMREYNNPGPIENNVYIPVRGEVGSISTAQIGGDGADPKSLIDLDYFKKLLFAGLGIPAQYLGDTDDATGFNGGTSLALISSRYAKKIRAIEGALIEMITDIIDLILLDRGMESYINKFEIKMQPPTTQEEKDRKDNVATGIGITRDIMDLLSDIEDTKTKLEILKVLLSGNLVNPELIAILQGLIDDMEEEASKEESTEEFSEEDEDLFSLEGESDFSSSDDSNLSLNSEASFSETSETGAETSEEANEGEEVLPSMNDLNRDFADNTEEF